ncbi:hypothetical protein [Mumia sp. DW29H23]|uniref:hypothetical protein n=1 Tax=Mumia sp. DW29H23 TaxID=3421241 RepID=UPI003D690747
MSYDVIPFPDPATAVPDRAERTERDELATLRAALAVCSNQLAHERERLAAALSESHAVRARLGRLERTLWFRATHTISRALGRGAEPPPAPRRHLRVVPVDGLESADWE